MNKNFDYIIPLGKNYNISIVCDDYLLTIKIDHILNSHFTSDILGFNNKLITICIKSIIGISSKFDKININSDGISINFNGILSNFNKYLKPLYTEKFDFIFNSIFLKDNISFVNYKVLLHNPHIWVFTPDIDITYNNMLNLMRLLHSPLIHYISLGLLYQVYNLYYPYLAFTIDKLYDFLYNLFYRLIRLLIYFKFKFSIFNIIAIFFLLIPKVNAAYLTDREYNIAYKVIASLGWPIYILLGYKVDTLSLHLSRDNDVKKRHKVYMGSLYFIWISTGIFFTNAFWYLTNSQTGNLSPSIVGAPLTILFASIWYKLAVFPTNSYYISLNSVFRSITESLMFISIVESTFGLWGLWSNIKNYRLLGIILGSISFVLLSLFLLVVERYRTSCIIYGVLYYTWWCSAVFSTNGIIEYFFLHYANLHLAIKIVILSLSTVLAATLYPDLYPHISFNSQMRNDNGIELTDLNNSNNNNINTSNNRFSFRGINLVYMLRIILRLFFLILAYVLAAAILFHPLTQ